MKLPFPFFRSALLALCFGSWLSGSARAEIAPQLYAQPADAVAALTTAVAAQDYVTLTNIFGSAVAEIVNPDKVQAANEFAQFATSLAQENRLVPESPTRQILEVGSGHDPFPVPLVEQGGRWFFDTAAGKDELLNRRIGRNELRTLSVMRTYVEAQREYASRDRDGDDVLEYAQKITSSPGLKDGLYWPVDLDGDESPLGPLFAAAQAEGYGDKSRDKSQREPFHGYFYKILTRQGSQVPGGRYDYIINGNMIGGFALVAYPAVYGETGVMTFLVNQQGKVYQKDLGPKTTRIAKGMSEYNPDSSWTVSPD